MRIGVVSVQGDFAEHRLALERALAHVGATGEVVEVRRPSQAESCDGLVLPGGESTTIHKLLASSGLRDTLLDRARAGTPILATCAGAILLSARGDDQVEATATKLLGLMDTEVARNAFGRQRDSFEAPVRIPAVGAPDVPGVFIRAPAFAAVWGRARAWATLPTGEVVGVEQGHRLALTFHPELSPDPRVHAYFVEKVSKAR